MNTLGSVGGLPTTASADQPNVQVTVVYGKIMYNWRTRFGDPSDSRKWRREAVPQ